MPISPASSSPEHIPPTVSGVAQPDTERQFWTDSLADGLVLWDWTLRKAHPISSDAVHDALADLLDQIRPRDAGGWFFRAGHRVKEAQLA